MNAPGLWIITTWDFVLLSFPLLCMDLQLQNMNLQKKLDFPNHKHDLIHIFKHYPPFLWQFFILRECSNYFFAAKLFALLKHFKLSLMVLCRLTTVIYMYVYYYIIQYNLQNKKLNNAPFEYNSLHKSSAGVPFSHTPFNIYTHSQYNTHIDPFIFIQITLQYEILFRDLLCQEMYMPHQKACEIEGIICSISTG